MSNLSKLEYIRTNLPFTASRFFKIRTKDGRLAPFEFNRAQLYVHSRLEDQKRRTGKVRAIILKGRQQGMSTYVSARFYHQTAFTPETTTFILSHQAKTTTPLFDMVKRYHDNMPEILRPVTDTSNKNQLKLAFVSADPVTHETVKSVSEYTVGTAGNENLGRGFTIKYLHCSEAAWYAKTDELETGLFQAVADLAGTEIILESTANGMNNMFYRKAMDALAGRGEYEVVFVPWFWQLEYSTTPPPSFALTPEEIVLKNNYNLTDSQMYWRRNKIVELKDEWKFMQEYPMNVMEAFIVSGESFFGQQAILNARKSTVTSPSSPVVIGVDCGRTNDRTVVVARRGRQVIFYKVYQNLFGDAGEPSVQLASILAQLITQLRAKKCFIDYGAGYGAIDILRSSGYRDVVHGVYFNQTPLQSDIYMNKRAEMYFAARDWFLESEVNIPDDDDFFTDLMCIPMYKTSNSGKKFIVPKSEIKVDYGRSPDITDALILTFAFPVHNDIIPSRSASVQTMNSPQRSSSVTIRRRSGVKNVNNSFNISY